MKGVLVHSTTIENLESILEDRALFDSSKTDPEFGEEDGYKEMLQNKIFFQLVPETIEITGNYKDERGFSNNILLFFDIQMLEEYGNKKYTKSKEQKEKLSKLSESKKIDYETNDIPKQKVWFNSGWYHGGFHLKPRGFDKDFQYSMNYDKTLSLEDNIQNFYDAKLTYIKYNIKELEKEYEEELEYNEENPEDLSDDEEFQKEREKYWKEELNPEWPTKFTHKAKNEVVFQPLKKDEGIPLQKYLLAIYSYHPKKIYNKLEKEYHEYLFLKTPKELQDFWKEYLLY
jgi:hypothetical protein